MEGPHHAAACTGAPAQGAGHLSRPHCQPLGGECDEDIAPSDTISITNSTPNSLEGPMTRACARHLNYKVLWFLMLYNTIHEDGMLLKSCYVLLLRNMGSA